MYLCLNHQRAIASLVESLRNPSKVARVGPSFPSPALLSSPTRPLSPPEAGGSDPCASRASRTRPGPPADPHPEPDISLTPFSAELRKHLWTACLTS